MPRFRPRISLLTALLLMTIVGMAIVIVQLWREVGPLRSEVRALRNEVGRLSIEDRSKIHAIRLRTDEDLTWKWRIWIPEGEQVDIHLQCGNVPRTGVPAWHNSCSLGPGEQTLILKVHRDRSGNQWFAKLESSTAGYVGTDIPADQQWFNWGLKVSTGEGVGLSTVAFDPAQKTIILDRNRVGKFSGSNELKKFDGPTAGFIIWMDRQ